MFDGVYVECSLSWAFVGDRTLLLGGYSLGCGLCIDRVFRWWFVFCTGKVVDFPAGISMVVCFLLKLVCTPTTIFCTGNLLGQEGMPAGST